MRRHAATVEQVTDEEGEAIDSALSYLSMREIHDSHSEHCYAEHFIDNGGRRTHPKGRKARR